MNGDHDRAKNRRPTARPDEAESIIGTAVAVARRGGDEPRRLCASLALGRCLFWKGRYAESRSVLALLAGLREGHAILLVEHDMDAVFRIADRITVLVDGSVIASGAPAAVRDNREVQNAYLGGVH